MNRIIEEFKDKKIAILGFGREGKSTYKYIRKHLPNIQITILDQNKNIKKDETLQNDKHINFVVGNNYLAKLEQYDLIMKTPGISFKGVDLSNIKDKISSQLELLLKYYKDSIVGITGTKGKSTTSSIIYAILKNNNIKSFLLGNIGTPIFDYVDDITHDTTLVVEMSSHQLEFVNYSPHIAIITNFYQDHLDHTNGLEDYYHAKLNIVRFQDSNDYLIYYKGCKVLDEHIKALGLTNHILTIGFDKDDYTYCDGNLVYINNQNIYNKNDKRSLIGDHNLINIMLALTTSRVMSLDIGKTKEAINNFQPLEHRLEKVGTYDDVTYYNDSIATIPDATINGIKALGNVNTLIFGGLDRGIDYSEFINYLNTCDTENLICMPTTGHTIANELIKMNSKKNIYLVNTLEEAVKKAIFVTKKGSICLMSPAAASYEYFKNFEEKGKAYKQLIKKLTKS